MLFAILLFFIIMKVLEVCDSTDLTPPPALGSCSAHAGKNHPQGLL